MNIILLFILLTYTTAKISFDCPENTFNELIEIPSSENCGVKCYCTKYGLEKPNLLALTHEASEDKKEYSECKSVIKGYYSDGVKEFNEATERVNILSFCN